MKNEFTIGEPVRVDLFGTIVRIEKRSGYDQGRFIDYVEYKVDTVLDDLPSTLYIHEKYIKKIT